MFLLWFFFFIFYFFYISTKGRFPLLQNRCTIYVLNSKMNFSLENIFEYLLCVQHWPGSENTVTDKINRTNVVSSVMELLFQKGR